MNRGFIKVNVENAPEIFESFDDDQITGYVVDLNLIEYDKLNTGHGYLEIVEGDTVTFEEDDVYLYDAVGNVYYACGYTLESGVVYTDAQESGDVLNGPTIEVVDTTLGHVILKITPYYGGKIKSVLIGGKEATTVDGETFTIDIAENGNYIVIAEEENGGATRTSLTISDIAETADGTPVILGVQINDGEEYTRTANATLKVTGNNCKKMSIIKDSETAPDADDSSKWKKYAKETSIVLSAGSNDYYVWGKNADGKVSTSYGHASIILDQVAPTRDAPSYTIEDRELTIKCNQKDALSDITVKYGYKKLGDQDFTWQESDTVSNITPGKAYVLVTKATDKAGNMSQSRETTTEVTDPIPSGVTITANPTTWAELVEVTIKYPSSIYNNVYRLNDGEWQTTSNNEVKFKLTSSTVVDASICAIDENNEMEFGNIETLNVTWIDRVNPTIYDVDTGSEDAQKGGYKISATARDDESGLVAWTITQSDTKPTTWDNEFDSTNSEVKIEKQIDDNGTYYIWAKDKLGHSTSTSFVISNIDKTDPILENYSCTFEKSKAKIAVIAHDRNLGLAAYAFIKGEDAEPKASDWIEIPVTTADYAINQTVTENGTYSIWAKDVSGRTAKIEKEIKVRYNVTFDYKTNGGTSISIANNKVEYGCNEQIDLSPTATKEGNRFIGWNTDPNASVALSTFTIGTEDAVLYAIFTKELKLTLKYYDETSLQTEVIAKDLFNQDENVTIDIKNITATYLGWNKLGWTTSTAKDAEVLYSGDNAKITISTDTTLYMMYEKTIDATFFYYDTSASSAKSETILKKLKSNAYNIESTTTATVTAPNVSETVEVNSKTWTLRGFSESAESNAKTTLASNGSVTINKDVTYYASYASTINANKYIYGSNTPETESIATTMSYNASIAKATINLKKAADATLSGDTWTADGWNDSNGIKDSVKYSNNTSVEIDGDTNFYAQYSRTITITEKYYNNLTTTQTGKAYLAQNGNTKNAEIIMKEYTNVEYDGTTWIARGYSKQSTPDAEIDLLKGDTLSTATNETYYVSYYANVTVTLQTLKSKSTEKISSYLASDGTIKSASITLPEVDSETYDSETWAGAGWSESSTQVTGTLISANTKINVTANKTYYAVYEKEVIVSKYTYNNVVNTLTGTARLNSSSEITDAEFNLTKASDVTVGASTWTQKKWSTVAGLDDAGTSYEPTSTVKSHKNINLYAVYTTPLTATINYYDGENKTMDIDLSTLMNYAGTTKNQGDNTFPALSDVEKDGCTWKLSGYLSSADGYTAEATEGTKYYTAGSKIEISKDTIFYAIYETTATLRQVKYDTTVEANYKIKMNSLGEVSGKEVTLGNIEDVTVDSKIWSGYGWSISGDSSEVKYMPQTNITLTKNETFYAVYKQEILVTANEYKDGTSMNVYTTSNVAYMCQNGTTTTTNVVAPNPKNNEVTIKESTWTFAGWANALNTAEISAESGATLTATESVNLYAVYKRNVKIETYIYNNTQGETYSGDAYSDAMGTIENATITLGQIEDQIIDEETWIAKGWSPSQSASETKNLVNSNGTLEAYADATYYALYKKNVSLNFYMLNGELEIFETTKQSEVLKNYISENYVSVVTVPVTANAGRWQPIGYTESLDEASVVKDSLISGTTVQKDSDTNFYAAYKDEVTLTYDPDGGTPTPEASKATAYFVTSQDGQTSEAQVTITEEKVIKSGYIFSEVWADEPSSTEGAITAGSTLVLTASKTMYAQYEAVKDEKVYAILYSDYFDFKNWKQYYTLGFNSTGVGEDGKTVKAIWEVEDYEKNGDRPWNDYMPYVTEVTIEDEIHPTSMAYWFACKDNAEDVINSIISENGTFDETINLLLDNDNKFTTINNIENIDTSNVTNMKFLFFGCDYLTNLDLSHFDTSKVTDMSGMFGWVSYPDLITTAAGNYIETLDLSSFDTSNVTNMAFMFAECKQLKTITIGEGFNTENVTNMSRMFKDCWVLEEFDFNKLNTSKVTNMAGMFSEYGISRYSGLTALTNIIDVSSFDTRNVTNMNMMFAKCSQTTEIYLGKNFDTSKVESMNYMFRNCNNLTTIYAVKDFDLTTIEETLSCYDIFTFDTKLCGGAGTSYEIISAINSDNLSYRNYTRIDGGLLKRPGFFTKNTQDDGTSIYAKLYDDGTLAFSNNNSKLSDKTLSEDYGEVSTIPTGETPWSGDAARISQSLIVNEIKPTLTAYMFAGLGNLTEIKNIENINMENVTSMEGMFGYCTSLDTVDVSSFDTSKVENMMGVFGYCTSLDTVDVNAFDTSNVETMMYMFAYCTSMEEIDISAFDTSSVTNMNGMFAYDSSLKDVNFGTIDTSKVEDMEYMFAECTGLEEIDISMFDTSSVTTMRGMFVDDESLEEIDLGAIDTSNVTEMSFMFGYCSNLVTIYASNNFVTTAVTESTSMFRGDSNLVGGAGTTYSDEYREKQYARIDQGPESEAPGYFTEYIPSTIYVKLYTDGTLAFSHDNGTISGKTVSKNYGDISNVDGSTSGMPWSADAESITQVVIVDKIKPTNTASWFNNLSKVTEIKNATNIITKNVTNMNSMFANCTGLTNLDLSSFKTNKVTDMASMFANDTNLTTIIVSDKFVTTSVTNDANMFINDTKLVGEAGTKYSASHVDSEYARIDEGPESEAPGYFTEVIGTAIYAKLYEDGTLAFSHNDKQIDGKTLKEDYGDISNEREEEMPWYDDAESITKVLFVNEIKPTWTAYWFMQLVNLSEITNIENLNTENVTNMEGMFAYCVSLTEIDVSNFNTSNVTSMRGLFGYCTGLEEIDVSSFDTSNVTLMMVMFAACENLNTIYVSDKFVTTAVEDDGQYMFMESPNLVGGAGTTYSEENVNVEYACIDEGPESENPGYFTAAVSKKVYVKLYTDGTLAFSNNSDALEGKTVSIDYGDISSIDGSTSGMPWNADAGSITQVVIVNKIKPTNTASWFNNLINITEIKNITNIDTSNVTNMNSMFANCSNLTTLDLSKFNTSKVTDMASMFANDSNLTTITASNKFVTTSVTNDENMFINDINLVGEAGTTYSSSHVDSEYARIDEGPASDAPGYFTEVVGSAIYAKLYDDGTLAFSHNAKQIAGKTLSEDYGNISSEREEEMPWYDDASRISQILIVNEIKPTWTAYWFMELTKVKEITNIENLNTEKVTSMEGMFAYCTGLKEIDLSNFDTSNVTSMMGMFGYCTSLKTLDLSTFDTSNVEDMMYMFGECTGLTKIDLSTFDTSNVENMNGMFGYCTSALEIDLSSFDTSNVTDMESMFAYCSAIETIDIGTFDTSSLTDMSYMFSACSNLTTIYASDKFVTAAVENGRYVFMESENLVGGAGTTYSENHVTYEYARIDQGPSSDAPGYFTEAIPKSIYVKLYTDGTLAFSHDNEEIAGKTLSKDYGNISKVDGATTDMPWKEDSASITSAIIVNRIKPVTTANWFNGLNQMIEITNIENINTEATTNMTGMFNGCSSLTTLDLSSFDTKKVTNMSSMFNGCTDLISVDTSCFNTSTVVNMESMFNGCANLTTLDFIEFDTSKVTNMKNMLNGCSSLITVYASEDFVTTSVTNSADMFLGCISIVGGKGTTYTASHIDKEYARVDGGASSSTPGYFTEYPGTIYVKLYDDGTLAFSHNNKQLAGKTVEEDYGEVSGIDGSVAGMPWLEDADYIYQVLIVNKVKPISTAGWFAMLSNVPKISGLEKINTINVTDMSGMFLGCSNMTTLNLDSKFNTSNVTNMRYMFYNCSGLETLDLGKNFYTSNVTNMTHMFDSCSSIYSLVLNEKFDTSSVTDMSSMFEGCEYLIFIYATDNFVTTSVTTDDDMFLDCYYIHGTAGTEYDEDHIDKEYARIDEGPWSERPGYFAGPEFLIYAKLYSDGTLTLSHNDDVISGDMLVKDYGNVSTAQDEMPWYGDKTNITQVLVVNEIKPFTTANWFYELTSLSEIINIENINTSYTLYMYDMFDGCMSLTTLDLSSFNTSNVEDMECMFEYCQNLVSLDLSSFDTSNVENMYGMFDGCSSLTLLNVSGFNTSNVTSMTNMFYGCSSLTTLNLSSFDTSNVTSMYNMFENCSSLTTLDLSSFDTSNVTDMDYMFYGCSSLETLDLSSFDTSSVYWMSSMFADCTNLKTIYATESFDTTTVNSSWSMFNNATSLVGGKGTTYSSSYTDKTYARVDDGPSSSTPGYFTARATSTYVKLYDDGTLAFSNNNSELSDRTVIEDYGEISAYAGSEMPWVKDSAEITQAMIVNKVSPVFTARWFKDLTSMTEIIDINKLNTSFVTNMESMFENCGIETIDISGFDTSNVSNMTSMFEGCQDLTTIWSKYEFDTSSLINSDNMFSGDTNLVGGEGTTYSSEHIDSEYARVDEITTRNVPGYFKEAIPTTIYAKLYDDGTLALSHNDITISGDSLTKSYGEFSTWESSNMPWANEQASITQVLIVNEIKPTSTAYWFYYLTNMTEIINIENLNTENVTDMSYMFYNATSLISLDLSSLDTSSVTDMTWMFGSCQSLTSLDVTGIDTSNVIDMQYMFYGCESLTSLDVTSFNTSNVTNMYGMFGYCSDLTSINLSNFNTTNAINMGGLFNGCSSLTSLDLTNFNTSKATNINWMFAYCENLASVDISSFNTSNVTDMSYMFYMCRSLTSINVNNFNTSNVTDMGGMFYYCDKLVSLNVTNFNTSNVTDMSYMFAECSTLTSLDVSNFNTSKVTNMHGMFDWCLNLTSLDVSGFDTSNVTNTAAMFYYCTQITSLDVSNFNTSKVTDMASMFAGLYNLVSLDLSNFDTTNVTRMGSMFSCDFALTSIDLSSFDTSNVTDMNGMFWCCSNLNTLDLSNFDTSNVTNMNHMFYSTGLTTIEVSDKFVTTNVTNSENMFLYSDDLVGCEGTTYSADHLDAEYARIDGGPLSDTPGYFSIPTPKTIYAKLYDGNTLALSHNDIIISGDSLTTDYGEISAWESYTMPWIANSGDITKVLIVNEIKPTVLASTFKDLTNMTEIINIENINTSNVTDMSRMFENCTNLASLDLSSFNTSKVSKMYSMFYNCSNLEELDVSSFNTSKVTSMNSMFSGCSKLTSLDLSSFDTSNVTSMYYMFFNDASLTSIDVSSFNTSNVQTMNSMFYCCTNLTSLDVSEFDTQNVTDMYWMFAWCENLETIDVSNFNTSKVYDMSGMFCMCRALKEVDVSHFDTSNANDMSCMFCGYRGATSLDLTNFDTSKVTNMNNMFQSSELKSIDISSFNTSKVTEMANMFAECTNLTTIYASDNFVTTKAKNSSLMFNKATSLVGGAGTTYSSSHVNKEYARIDGGPESDTPGYFTLPTPTTIYAKLYDGNTLALSHNDITISGDSLTKSYGEISTWSSWSMPWINESGDITKVLIVNEIKPTSTARWFSNLTNLTEIVNIENLNTSNVRYMYNMFENCASLTSLDLSGFDTSKVTSMGYMFYKCSSLTSLDISHFDTSNVTTMRYMFDSCSKLASLNVTGFNTGNVIDMYAMFSDCNNVQSLDVSKFDTSKVTSMGYMFYKCSSLTSLDISHFDTTNVTDMSCMFMCCTRLTTLDVSNFDTSNVTNMSHMFGWCEGLTSLDMSGFDTGNVTNMSWMFYDCSKLTTLDVSSFDTSKVGWMEYMFYNCSSLTSLDISHFDTSNVTNMGFMFDSCSKLVSLNVTGFNTSNVTNMRQMFYCCDLLTSLDVSSFDTSNVTVMGHMFYNTGLTKIEVSDKFVTTSVTDSEDMFYGSTNLVGGEGTKYSEDHVDAEYARIDGGQYSDTPGYFTAPTPTTIYAKLYDGNTLALSHNDITISGDSLTKSYGEISTWSSWQMPWIDESGDITKVLIVNEIKPTSTAYWFSSLTNLTEIVNIENLNTENVTNMHNMFNYCTNLTSLDISGFDTRKVTDMGWMFVDCSKLTTLDVSGFDTSNVTNMDLMFLRCSELTTLDVSNFDTSNVTSMQWMFNGCSNVKELDVGGFNTSNVEDMSMMFEFCSSIEELDVSNFNTSKVTNMSEMFYYCSSLKSIDVSSFDTSNVTGMGGMFYKCSSLTSLDLSSFDTSNVSGASAMFSGCSSLTSLNLNNFNTVNITSLNCMFSGCSSLRSLDLSSFDTRNVEGMNAVFCNCTNLETLNIRSFNTSKVTDMSLMFYCCSSLTALDVSNFDTSNVVNMNSMFGYCSRLTELDVSAFDTSNVEYMSSMFAGCRSLTSLDVSGFNTSKVTHMRYMFYSCSKLSLLDVSNFDTSNVTRMCGMFEGCSNLTSLDVSDFDTSKVEEMDYMFSVTGLTTIYASDKFVTTNVTDSLGMFSGSTNLVGGEGTTYSYEHVDAEYARIDGGPESDTPGYFSIPTPTTIYAKLYDGNTLALSHNDIIISGDSLTTDYGEISTWGSNDMPWIDESGDITKVVIVNEIKPTSTAYWFKNLTNLTEIVNIENLNTSNVTKMYQMFYECQSLISLDVSNFNTSKVRDMSEMFFNCRSLTSLDLSSFDTSKITNTYMMFKWCENLLTLNLSSFDTSNVTGMASMFQGCSNLKTLDVSNFNTSKVKSMYAMFSSCESIETLNVSNFDTSNVTDMLYMFCGCSNLKTLDVSGFNTGKVENMSAMFIACDSLEEIDVSGFDTSNVKDMSSMFSGCKSLTSLDLSNFDTSNVEDMRRMFSYSKVLTTLNLSSFDTSNVEDISGMFENCDSLTSIDLTNFDTSNVKDMDRMFYQCDELSTIDISSFDTANVTDMKGMFNYCPNLTTIYASDKFVTTNVTSSESMFYDSTNLVGCEGTQYSSSHVDKEYARIDGGQYSDTPGYFTAPTPTTIYAKLYDGNTLALSHNDVIISGDSFTKSYGEISTWGTRNMPWIDESGDITKVVIVNEIKPTSTAYWFMHLTNLTEIINIEKLNTSNVTNMYGMFEDCESLETIDLSNFDTSKVKDMADMFWRCLSLTSIDLSSFDTSKVTNMSRMFYNCAEAISIDVSSFDTSNTTDLEWMFAWCGNLETADVSGFNTSQVTDMSYMFYGCSNLTELDVSNFDTSNVADMSGMFCVKATYIDVSNFDTSNVTDMESMFGGCSNLETLDVSNFDTSKVEDMSNMFCYCKELNEIDVSNFDTSSIKGSGMYNMFSYCESVEELDVSGFDTSNTTYMYGMFKYCKKLTSLDLRSFDTSKVTNMEEMFHSCENLTSLDLSNFDTANVTDVYNMFGDCKSLTSLDLSNFDTSSVPLMNSVFYNCSSLTKLDLSSFDVSNVSDMSWMFTNCSNLTSLDLSSFDTSDVSSTYAMFKGCTNLTTIYVSDKFVTTNLESDGDMFYGATKLVGGAGTKYSEDHTDAEYARIDGGPESDTPGYFSIPTPKTIYAKLYDGNTLALSHDDITISGDSLTKSYGEISTWSSDTMPWITESGDITKVLIVNEIKPTSTSGWFEGLKNMTEVINEENINTSNVTSMSGMFYECSKLASVDLSSFDTSKVKNMNAMFAGCSSLTSLNLDSFDTNNVKGMSMMFNSCSSLTSLDLRNFDTSNVETMQMMFEACTKLETLDISTFDTSNVTSTYWMFAACKALKELNLSSFDTSNVTDMEHMFIGCSSLTSLDLTSFDTSNVTDMTSMFDGCSALTTVNLSSFDTSEVTSLHGMFYKCTSLASINLSNFDTSKVENLGCIFEDCESLKTIDLSNFDTSNVYGMGQMFYGCSEVTSINVSSFDTSNVTRMNYMFSGCEKLNSLNLSSFNTSKVTEMWEMFKDCETLTTLDLSSFDVSNVEAMSYMFFGCSGLETLNISNFNTSSVTDMYSLFEFCSSLTSLDMSGFDTSNVTDLEDLFGNCENLTELDLSSFDTSNVTNMLSMFNGCTKLETINLSSFDTSKVTNMGGMFNGCSSLKSLNLGNFNTNLVTSMGYMFSSCSSLTTLDLGKFNTSNVEKTERMFYGCTNLTTIYVSDKFVTTNVTDSDKMFLKSTSLVGGSGTTYSESHVDATYAHIDTAGNPGYFTASN